jgi:hypothetical protein
MSKINDFWITFFNQESSFLCITILIAVKAPTFLFANFHLVLNGECDVNEKDANCVPIKYVKKN